MPIFAAHATNFPLIYSGPLSTRIICGLPPNQLFETNKKSMCHQSMKRGLQSCNHKGGGGVFNTQGCAEAPLRPHALNQEIHQQGRGQHHCYCQDHRPRGPVAGHAAFGAVGIVQPLDGTRCGFSQQANDAVINRPNHP